MAYYGNAIVTPAFSRVEAPSAPLHDVQAFFDYQIDQAVSFGLPALGASRPTSLI